MFLLVGLLACTATDGTETADTGTPGPQITLLRPTEGEAVQVDASGQIAFEIEVHIDGFDYTPQDMGLEPVSGQGHFHVELNDVYQGAPDTLTSTVEADGFTTGDQLLLNVVLTENDHSVIQPTVSDHVELSAVAAR